MSTPSIEPARIFISELGKYYNQFEWAFARFKWDLEFSAMKGGFNTERYIFLRDKYTRYLTRFQAYAKYMQEHMPYMSEHQHETYEGILKEFNKVYQLRSEEISIIVENAGSPEIIKHLLYAK